MGRRGFASIVSRILYLLPWHAVSPEHGFAASYLSRCGVVVDIGCGGGGLYEILRRAGWDGEYICVELYIPPRIAHTIHSDASRPPLRDRCCGCCVFLDSLFYISRDPVSLLRAWASICEEILVIDLNPSMPYIHNKLVDLIEGIGRRDPEKLSLEAIGKGLRAKILRRGSWYAVKIMPP
ncbi:MAG: class I SAM-dependent methyltransferase [Sulfolobales archaeon]